MNCIYIIFYFIFIKILFLYTKCNNSFRIKIWDLISLLSDSIYLNRNLWNGLINRKIIPIFPLRLISCLICYRQPYRIVPAIFLEANFAYSTLPNQVKNSFPLLSQLLFLKNYNIVSDYSDHTPLLSLVLCYL